MDDLISRQAAIRWVKTECNPYGKPTLDFESGKKVIEHLEQMPSAQPKLPPYVVEIEAEYRKAVKQPHIHKPLAKALYEVWKKHDREDVSRNG